MRQRLCCINSMLTSLLPKFLLEQRTNKQFKALNTAAVSLLVRLCNLCRLLHDGRTKMPNSPPLLYSAFLTLLRRDLCSCRSPHTKEGIQICRLMVLLLRTATKCYCCVKNRPFSSAAATVWPVRVIWGGRQLIQTWRGRPPTLSPSSRL